MHFGCGEGWGGEVEARRGKKRYGDIFKLLQLAINAH
jgi:hypothetical protein